MNGARPACIADDFTGAVGLADMLMRGGMRRVQTIGACASNAAGDATARHTCRHRAPRTCPHECRAYHTLFKELPLCLALPPIYR
jgi:hypothetical protein